MGIGFVGAAVGFVVGRALGFDVGRALGLGVGLGVGGLGVGLGVGLAAARTLPGGPRRKPDEHACWSSGSHGVDESPRCWPVECPRNSSATKKQKCRKYISTI